MQMGKRQAFGTKNFYKNNTESQIKKDCLENLKSEIVKIDGHISRKLMPFDLNSLDSALSGGLALGRVHALCGKMQKHGAVSSFAVALLIRILKYMYAPGEPVGSIVWCPVSVNGGVGMLYGHGLADLGLDPANLLIVNTSNPTHRMAALNDIVRTNGLAAVVAEYDGMQKPLDYWMRLIRRIQLAADSSKVTVLLLGAPFMLSSFETVWYIAPSNLSYPFLKSASKLWHPAWEVTLQRARGGYPFQGHVGWDLSSKRFMELSTCQHVVKKQAMPQMA